MTLDSIAHVVDIISGVAVVVSLVYLSVQLRQNTRALQATTYNMATANSLAILGSLYSNPELPEFLSRMNSMPDSVTPAEKLRFDSLMLTAFRHWDNLYFQFRCGTLDAEMWQSYNSTMTRYLANEAWGLWFLDNSDSFSQHLRALVQDCLQPVQVQLPEA